MPCLVEISTVVQEKKIFEFRQCFRSYLTFEEGELHHLKKFNPHHPMILCAKFG